MAQLLLALSSRPTDKIKIEQISIQAFVPFIDISALIAFTVEFLSTSESLEHFLKKLLFSQ